jgi:hypothetical protein
VKKMLKPFEYKQKKKFIRTEEVLGIGIEIFVVEIWVF